MYYVSINPNFVYQTCICDNTPYRYQETYFVIDSFDQLMRETAPDFTPIYARLKNG
jgi:phenylalanine-4-hydroxylase